MKKIQLLAIQATHTTNNTKLAEHIQLLTINYTIS